MQPLRCAADMLLFGDDDEIAKLAQIDHGDALRVSSVSHCVLDGLGLAI
jgi:hypothetical protein